jgi:hypothetical protein
MPLLGLLVVICIAALGGVWAAANGEVNSVREDQREYEARSTVEFRRINDKLDKLLLLGRGR